MSVLLETIIQTFQNPWISGLLIALIVAIAIYMRSELLVRKFWRPIRAWFDNRYTVRESAIQSIESDNNTKEIYVVVNHLDYELNDDLKYDEIMAKNVNREVTYYYILPKSARADWERLKEHLLAKGAQCDKLPERLKARFLDDRFTSIVVYGLAIYVGRAPYTYKSREHKVIAVQYSKDFSHSILVETRIDSLPGAKAVDCIRALFVASKQKFKCDYA